LNQATQQNASASEELAATSEEMGGQAQQLQELMTFFRLADGGHAVAAQRKAVTAKRPPAATSTSSPRTKRPVRSTAVAASENDFERF
ncbi:MAG: hypothetical protein ABTS22_10480, partial [Accumulibacter sp.]